MTKVFLLIAAFGSMPAFANGGSDSGFTALTELTGGAGSSGSQSSIQSRNMVYSELALRLGYRYEWLAPVIEGTYRYLGQTTDAATVNGTNMAGAGYLLGAGLDAEFSKFSIAAMYDFSGAFALAKATASGASESFTNPAGFRVSLGIHLNQYWDLILTYSNINYSSSKTDSTTTSLSGDLMNQTLYGLGIQVVL